MNGHSVWGLRFEWTAKWNVMANGHDFDGERPPGGRHPHKLYIFYTDFKSSPYRFETNWKLVFPLLEVTLSTQKNLMDELSRICQ